MNQSFGKNIAKVKQIVFRFSHAANAKVAIAMTRLFSISGDLERRLVTWMTLILIGLGMLFVVPILTRKIPYSGDHGTFFFPLRMLYSQCLARGDSIDWMPQLFGGFFTSGEGQQGVYHPFHLLIYTLFPVDLAYGLDCLIPTLLMPIGMVWFLRRFIGMPGAVMGAIVFTYSQAFTHALDNPPTTMIFAHLPWVLTLMCVAIASQSRSKRCLSCIGIAFLTSSQVMLGYPQITWFCLFSESVFALFLFRQHRFSWRAWSALGIAYVLAGLLSGIQLLATYDHLGGSTRAHVSMEIKCLYSMPPSALVGALAPYLHWGRAPTWLCVYYGAFPLLLTLWWVTVHRIKSFSSGNDSKGGDAAEHPENLQSFVSANRLFTVAFVMFILSTWLSLGNHGKLYYLQTYLPLIGSFRAPARYWIVADFGVAIMAAVVFARLVSFVKAKQSLPYRHLILPWLAVAASFGFAVYFSMSEPVFSGASFQAQTYSGPLLFTLAGIALTLASRGSRAGLFGLVVLCVIDLSLNNLMHPQCRVNWSLSKLATMKQYLTDSNAPPTSDGGRVYDNGFWGNKHAVEGRRAISGYAGLEPARYLDYKDVNSLRVAEVSWVNRCDVDSKTSIAGLGDATADGWRAVPNPLPRARLLSQTVLSWNPFQDIKNIDVDRVALTFRELELPQSTPGSCQIREDRPGQIEIEVTASEKQLLTVSESHRRGWKAYIDGRPIAVEQINGDFLGCVVPPGQHRVLFKFDPQSLLWGKAFSLAGVVISFGLICLAWQWARSERRSSLDSAVSLQSDNDSGWSPQLSTGSIVSLPGLNQRIVVCIPIFNDWASAQMLLKNIDGVVSRHCLNASVLFVDDGSTDDVPESFSIRLTGVDEVEILKLRQNVGHQRAIALGLTYIHENRSCAAVVVMDGDGEDSPDHIIDLLNRFISCEGKRAIFAQRSRRSEGFVFRCFYRCYKSLHRLLTGRKVEVGNFSIIPAPMLERLVGVSDLWNHYAASVFKHRLPVAKVPIPRANRLHGESKMNFVSLVTHGLSAISVFGEQVYTRILVANTVLAAATFVVVSVVIGIRLSTDIFIPGWATFTMGLLATLLLNSLLFSLLFVVSMLQSRNNAAFLPLRDYKYYVGDLKNIACKYSEELIQQECAETPQRKVA